MDLSFVLIQTIICIDSNLNTTEVMVESAADVISDIERRVTDGVLQAGDRLPPVRTLAHQVGLAPNTVAAAYRALQSRGILVGRGRAGTFVADRPPLGSAMTTSVPKGVVDMATGNPDPALLPDLGAAFDTTGASAVYGLDQVLPEFRDAAERWLGGDGIPTSHIVPVSGALDGIERALGAHLRAGDHVVVEDPAYSAVVDLVGALGLVAVPVEVDDFGLRPDRLAAALKRGPAAVLVTPRAQNPSGAAMDEARAGSLREVLAASPEVFVVEDDHAARVSGSESLSLVDPDRRKWVHVRSLAKEFGPDLRLAIASADATTASRMLGRQRVGPGWVSHIVQRAGARLLSDPTAVGLLSRAAAAYAARRDVLISRLSEAGIEAHGRSGLNVWVPVRDEAAVVAGMLERGYAVRSGAGFRYASPPGVRITVAGHSEATVLEAAGALVDVWAQRSGRSG